MLKNNSGISLMTLIVTIVVIIILAAIVIYNGFNTPEQATLAKFKTEISDFSLSVIDDFIDTNTEFIVNGQDRTDAQIYYMIASGKETIGKNEEPVVAGKVGELGVTILPMDLKGNEYYEITNDKNIDKWNSDVQYYTSTEKHYVTDEGVVFILPGYLDENNGEKRWWINDELYYLGKGITEENNLDDGVEVAITNISLNEPSGVLMVNESKTLIATINANATEKLIWESSKPSIVTVTPSADTKSAIIVGLLAGTSVTITVKNQDGTISATYVVTEVKEPVQLTDANIGDFVEYGVEYTDVYYNTYTYNSKNGWRLLNQTPVGNGKYDIEIVSTGIPAKLYYCADDTLDNVSWCADENQITKYIETYCPGSSNREYNMKAAAGLLYNFESINFLKRTSVGNKNEGYYTDISGNYSGAGNLFKASNIALGKMKVRSMMYEDIKEISPTGLFFLGQLSTITDAVERGVNNYTYDKLYYWLASPDDGSTVVLKQIYKDGPGGNANSDRGVRPVVSISGVKMDYVDGVWKIIQ